RVRGKNVQLGERSASVDLTSLENEISLFFFSSRRRHTRLQGDWSSDVCSSDLDKRPKLKERAAPVIQFFHTHKLQILFSYRFLRSEERRVGKECRFRWWPEHYKKNSGEKKAVVDH